MENSNNHSNDGFINLADPHSPDSAALTNVRRRNPAFKIPHYRIEEIRPVGNNQVLTDYLKNLGIWDISNESLREIYYYTIDERKNKKNYFGIGWQNVDGDWEVRNKYYVGCLGSRKLTYIMANPKCLVIFEFYFNYLTWKRYYLGSTHSVIVLNTLDSLNRAIEISKEYALVQLYFSHKESGRLATKTFMTAAPHVTDRSVEYANYPEYNDKLTAQLRGFRLQHSQPNYPSTDAKKS